MEIQTAIDVGFPSTQVSSSAITLHFYEPIPDFRMVQAKENFDWYLPAGKIAPLYRAPAVMQGHGFPNIGDETLFWYSTTNGHTGIARYRSDKPYPQYYAQHTVEKASIALASSDRTQDGFNSER
jgi:hypothetical protein